MALIMYFTRAPRYEDMPVDYIAIIEEYLQWQHEKDVKGKYACDTFEEWCGIPESKIPNMEIINYYRPYFTKKTMYVEGVGQMECNTIFEQLARIVKNNQIFNWFIKNVMNNYPTNDYYKVTKEQLEMVLGNCNKVKNGFIILDNDKYEINEDIAKEFLPLLENPGHFFGTNEYGKTYANQIIEVIDIIERILKTTDFEKQNIYFNAIW